ncbi:unnamed protein product, partial [Rotaria sp. Silwood2]
YRRLFFLQCPTRFQHCVYYVELNIDYKNDIASRTFDYHSDRANISDDINSKPRMIIEVHKAILNFQRKRASKVIWISFCAIDDECDRIYMVNHLLHIA